MKNRVLAIWAAMLFLGWCTWKIASQVVPWGTLTGSPTFTATETSSGSGVYKFSFQNLPTFPSSDPDGEWTAAIWVDDGGAPINVPISQLATKTYQLSGTHTPHAEVTAIYDDNKRESRAIPPASTSGTITGSGGTNAAMNMHGRNVLITKARNPVPGDIQTYFVTVKNPCSSSSTASVKFEYPTDLFEAAVFENHSSFFSTAALTAGRAIWATSSVLTASQEQTLLVQLKVKPNAPIGTACRVIATASFKEGSGCPITLPSADTLGEPIAKSHDPNSKSADRLSVKQMGDELIYTIRFTNDGYVSPKKIIVEDVLDLDLENRIDNFHFLRSGFNLMTETPPEPFFKEGALNSTTRKARWVIDTENKLPGLASGASQENATLAFSFKTTVRQTDPCGAIANQARIWFDCNTPHETNLVITPMERCTTATDFCTRDTQIVIQRNLPVSKGKPIADALGTAYSTAFSNFKTTPPPHFKWYPHTDLDDPRIRAPKFVVDPKFQDYLLIVSESCHRKEMILTADPGCHSFKIALDAGQSHLNVFWPFSKGDATVSVPNSASHLLKWSDCSTGTSGKMTFSNLAVGVHFLGVTDLATGCHHEIAVTVRSNFKKWGSWPYVLIGALGILAFLYFRKREKTKIR